MAFEKTISVNGIDLFTVSIGEGTPVIFVHGGPGLGHYYLRPAMDALAQDFGVIAYDQRGCGRSTPISADQLTLDGHLADLEGLRRALNIERLNLIGHSFGALFAFLYAAKHPEITASLVLSNAGPPFAPEMQEMLHREFVGRQTPEARKRMKEIEASPGFEARDVKTIEEYFKIMYSSFFRDRTDIARLSFGFTETTAQHVLGAEEMMIPQVLEQDPIGKLGKIDCPTLVVHAEYDLIPEDSSRFLAQHIRGAEYALLKGIGHFGYLEDADLFRNTVVPFLKRNAK